MKAVDSNNYEFVWSMGGIHYLLTSLWIREHYLDWDFLIWNIGDEHHLFLSHDDFIALGEKGLELLTVEFDQYRLGVERLLDQNEDFFVQERNRPLKQLSDDDLLRRFEYVVDYIARLTRFYFWTEYFCIGSAEDALHRGKEYRGDVNLFERVDEMARLKYTQREYINHIFFQPNIMDAYYREIGKRFDLGEHIYHYHFQELYRLFRGEGVTIPDRSVFVQGKFSGWRDVLGDEARGVIDLFQLPSEQDEISGRIGHTGYYKGRVKMITMSTHTDYVQAAYEMKRGDVLVSTATGPEMMLACKKAGAIVTDEGGITAHAALIARELGIPCIVGTKIATRVLRDGDVVEVDADRGIVRKL